jgi:NAD(P)-dependent dehydrogenase (short-subunit alcohol dehydrogenase family)
VTGRLDGKVALITGTAGGQGRAAALPFAAEGATVAGCDVSAGGAAETVELVRAAGGRMDSTHPLDLADEDGVTAWVDAAAERHGGINILYNNAGATRVAPITGSTFADWSFTIRNELDIVFLVTTHTWPHLVHDQHADRAHRQQGRRHRDDQAAGRRGRPARDPRQLHQPRHDPRPR